MTFLGYLGSILIGLTLGVLGSGGSILTVPVLVYLLHFSPLLATGYSLFIVGITSFIGAFDYMRSKLVDYKIALIFAVPSFVSVYMVRRFLLPIIPETVFEIGSFILYKEVMIMVIFAIMMIAAAISMISSQSIISTGRKGSYSEIAILGLVVGAITGLVSVGGGFLIIPSLVVFARIPIRMAVGTSLLVIATNALVGFAGELHNNPAVDWKFLIYFSLFSIFGIIIGSKFSLKIPTSKLKPFFGWFVLIMGCYIIFKELLQKS